MRYLLYLLPLVSLTLVPTSSRAEISDDLDEELRERAEDHLSEDESLSTRAALLTLGILGGDEAEKTLKSHKTKDDASVRISAGMGLMYADVDEAESFLVEQLQNQSPLYPVLRDHVALLPDDKETSLLTALIEATSSETHGAIFRYLARQRGSLAELLGTYATHDKDSMRSAALTAVRATAHPRGFEWGKELVQSGDETLENDGLELILALSRLPNRHQEAISALKVALESGSTSVQLKAAERLLELNDRSPTDPLVSMLEKAETTETKRTIATLLLEYDIVPSADMVTKMRTSTDNAELKQLLLNLAVSAGDEKTLEKVREMYGSTTFDKRLRAARALGYADEEAVSTLGRALVTEGNPEMRRVAARGLRRLGSEEALSALKKAIGQEKKKTIKQEIIRALGRIGTDEAVQILQFNATVRDPDLKRTIIQAVREAGRDKGFEVLSLMSDARDVELKWRAFLAALSLDPERAMENSDSALRRPPEGFVRDIAELDLKAQTTVLRRLLTHDTPRVREAALRHARKLGAPLMGRLRELLIDAEAPSDVRQSIVQLFAARRSPDNTVYLEKIIRDGTSKPLARRAAWALTQYTDQDLNASFRGYFDHDDAAIQAISTYGLASIERTRDGDDG